MKTLIFIGYNLTNSPLDEISLVSGEIKNANYLMQSLKDLDIEVIPISVDLYHKTAEKNDYSLLKSSSKGVFRWFFESKKINHFLSMLPMKMDSTLIYLTVPSYLPFLKIPKGVKVIVTAHGTYWPELLADLKYERSFLKKTLHLINGYIQMSIDKYAFKKANFLHSVSDFQIKEMIETYKIPKDRIQAIRNGTNFLNLNSKKLYDIIWVGRLAKKKNIKLLKDFIDRYPNLKFCIVGGNKYFAIDPISVQIMRQLELNSNVEVYSDLSDRDVNKLMCSSKYLFVTSTGYESIPTVIFEGLASGCKVLSPDSWGVREVEGIGLMYYAEGELSSLIDAYENTTQNQVSPLVYDSVRWQQRGQEFKEYFNL